MDRIVGVFGLAEAAETLMVTAGEVVPMWAWGYSVGSGVFVIVAAAISSRGVAAIKGAFWVVFGLLGAFGTPSQLAFSGRLWAWATLAMLGVAAFMLALHATLTFRKRARRRPTPKIELRIGSSRPGGAL